MFWCDANLRKCTYSYLSVPVMVSLLSICVLQVTVVDFPLYEILEHLRTLKPDILVNFPKLNDFMCKIEALPAIKKYMGSNNFIKSPFHNP